MTDILHEHALWSLIVDDAGAEKLETLYRNQLRAFGMMTTKQDIWHVYDAVPQEVSRFLPYILEGKLDGAIYTSRACRCLKGTLGCLAGVPLPDDYRHFEGSYLDLHNQMEVFWSKHNIRLDSTSPSELLVMAIDEDDTPDTEPASQLLLRWTLEWLERQAI